MAFWTQIICTSSGGGSITLMIPISGAVDGSNTSFTFSSAPKIIVVDQGRSMQKVSTDGEVNWTGTTSISLTVAPTQDIYAIA